MFEKFTEQGLKILNDARAEAEMRRHPVVDIAHLALAVLRDGKAMQILKDKGLSPEKMRMGIEKSLPLGTHVNKCGDIPFSPRVIKALQFAIEEAKQQGKENHVGSAHILLVIMKQFLLHKNV